MFTIYMVEFLNGKTKISQYYDSKGKETDNVHAFSKAWSKWLLKGHKVYDTTLDKI